MTTETTETTETYSCRAFNLNRASSAEQVQEWLNTMAESGFRLVATHASTTTRRLYVLERKGPGRATVDQPQGDL